MQDNRAPGFKYYHLRYFTPRNTNIGLVVDRAAKGGLTVAYKYKDNTLMVGLAFCSMKDHYNKALGRIKASHRVMYVVDNCSKEESQDFLKELLQSFTNDYTELDRKKVSQHKKEIMYADQFVNEWQRRNAV